MLVEGVSAFLYCTAKLPVGNNKWLCPKAVISGSANCCIVSNSEVIVKRSRRT